MPSINYIFASYVHTDLAAVEPIIKALNDEFGSRGVAASVWFNPDELQPGESWVGAIRRALRECIGFLVFVSPNSIASDVVRDELVVALEKPDNLIIPILLESVPSLPPELATRQAFDLSVIEGARGDQAEAALREGLGRIVDLIEEYLERDTVSPVVPASAAPALAATIAGETRDVQQKATTAAAAPDSVFVVHGHDNLALEQVNGYLTSLGIKSVILGRIVGLEQSLFQKFLKSSAAARFAIVILTPDDRGASRAQYDSVGVGERALKFRARQNVILELGFFYGQLGWENVFVVYRSDEVFPDFERPSDLDGIVFVAIDAAGLWQEVLTEKLVEAGFQLNRPA